MARYRVLEKSFIGAVIVLTGAEIDYDGKPDANLEPLDDDAKDAAAARAAELADARVKAAKKNSVDDLI